MNVYVASSFLNKQAVRAAMEAIRSAGHAITHDWTTYEVGQDETSVDAFHEECGRMDFNGVVYADALILLAHPDMRDAYAEMGIALGSGRRVLVVGAERRHSVFYGLTERYDSVEAAVEAL